MGLTERTQRTFLGIAHGKITQKNPDGTVKTYDQLSGCLTEIRTRTNEIKGIPTKFLDFIITDQYGTYDLSTVAYGGVARSIILSLANVEDFRGNTVEINPYLSKDNEHTNISVKVNGQKQSWITAEIPRVQEVRHGTMVTKDDTERMKFTDYYIGLVQRRLEAVRDVAAQAPAPAQQQYQPQYQQQPPMQQAPQQAPPQYAARQQAAPPAYAGQPMGAPQYQQGGTDPYENLEPMPEDNFGPY